MLKKVLSVLCLSTISSLAISMESDTSLQAQHVFKNVAELIASKKEETATEVLCTHQKLWPTLFYRPSDQDGNNLLHLACKNHCYEVTSYLESNGFPFWRKNDTDKFAWEVRCDNGPTCSECLEISKSLRKKNKDRPSRLSIVGKGGDLAMQFEIAKQYSLEKAELKSLIEDLIDAHQFLEAQELIESSTSLALKPSLIKAIRIWKKYPKNDHVEDLLRALLSEFAESELEDGAIDALFESSPLKSKYNTLLSMRDHPQILNIPSQNSALSKKRTHSFFSRKRVLYFACGIIASVALGALISHKKSRDLTVIKIRFC